MIYRIPPGNSNFFCSIPKKFGGAPGRNRTCDNRFRTLVTGLLSGRQQAGGRFSLFCEHRRNRPSEISSLGTTGVLGSIAPETLVVVAQSELKNLCQDTRSCSGVRFLHDVMNMLSHGVCRNP